MTKQMLKYFKGYEKYAVLTPLFLIGGVFIEVLIPTITSNIIDIGIVERNGDYVVKYGLIIIAMALVGVVLGLLGARFSAVAGTGFAYNMRGDLLDRVQSFSFSSVDKFSTASLLARLTADVINTQNAFITVLRIGGRSPVMFVFALIMALGINKKITLIFLFAIPAILVAFIILARLAFPRFTEMLTEFDNLNAITQENLSGIRVVKSFAREEYEEEKFRAVAGRVRDTQRKAEHIIVIAFPLMQAIMYACMIGVFWFGGELVAFGEIGVGKFLSLFSYVMQILMSLIMIAGVFVEVMMSRASMLRVNEVLMEPITLTDGEENLLSVLDGSITFQSVDFSYNQKDVVLSDLNFHIESGQRVGIMGTTGASKTSLVQLIPRLYDATKGKVLVGGRDVKGYNVEALRDQVAVVLQSNTLFSGTISDNLRWGNPNATQDELEQACKIASAHDFVSAFPQGYESWVEQGGVNLSGGQKQRLCIARALLKRPKILILDDSTSAVDTETDASIRRGLRENLADTTVLIISQRVSSLQDADQILVLEKGSIVEAGTHKELLALAGIYKEISDAQHSGEGMA